MMLTETEVKAEMLLQDLLKIVEEREPNRQERLPVVLTAAVKLMAAATARSFAHAENADQSAQNAEKTKEVVGAAFLKEYSSLFTRWPYNQQDRINTDPIDVPSVYLNATRVGIRAADDIAGSPT